MSRAKRTSRGSSAPSGLTPSSTALPTTMSMAPRTTPREAFDGNAFAVLALARAARDTSATLVHYGTDFVFDGLADRALHETRYRRGPASVYGMSKLLGEWFAADAPAHYILRVESLFGGPRAKSSVDRIIDGICRRAAGARVLRSHRDAQLRQRCRGRDGAATRRAPGFGLVSLRQHRHDHLARAGRRSRATAGPIGGSAAGRGRQRADESQASAVLRAVERETRRGRDPDADVAERARPIRQRSARAGTSHRQAPATSADTIRPIARHEVSPGESIPAAWISAGTIASRRIMKSANDASGGCSLARIPEPASRRSSELNAGQQLARRFQEVVPRRSRSDS